MAPVSRSASPRAPIACEPGGDRAAGAPASAPVAFVGERHVPRPCTGPGPVDSGRPRTARVSRYGHDRFKAYYFHRDDVKIRMRRTLLLSLLAAGLLAGLLIVAGCTGAAPPTNTTPATTSTMSNNTPAGANLTPDGLIRLTADLAAQVNGDRFATAVARGAGSTEYAAMVTELRGLYTKDSRIRWLFTFEQVNGTVRTQIEPGTETEPQANSGEVYLDPPKEFLTPITAPGTTGVYTDEWGTQNTGYAPIRNQAGQVVGILAIDVDPVV